MKHLVKYQFLEDILGHSLSFKGHKMAPKDLQVEANMVLTEKARIRSLGRDFCPLGFPPLVLSCSFSVVGRNLEGSKSEEQRIVGGDTEVV